MTILMKMAENSPKDKKKKNALGKGEIAHYKQFFPFPTVFCRHVKLRDNLEKGCHLYIFSVVSLADDKISVT